MLEIEKLNHYYSQSHTLWDFDLALDWYSGRQRRFGKTGQQVQQEQLS